MLIYYHKQKGRGKKMKKLVVITGASSGFGKEMAILFSKHGYPTLLLARNVKPIEELNLDNCIIKSVDVTDINALKDAINVAENRFGPVDLLINNAGCMLLGNIENQDPEEWARMINLNLIGVLNGIQQVLTKMKERNSGTIINVSSIAGKKAFSNHAAYCATKFGVHAISETLREEVSSFNVRILCLAPGACETPLLSHTTNKDIINDYNAWKETMGGITLDPSHIATCSLFMYQLPQEVSIRELVISHTRQDS